MDPDDPRAAVWQSLNVVLIVIVLILVLLAPAIVVACWVALL